MNPYVAGAVGGVMLLLAIGLYMSNSKVKELTAQVAVMQTDIDDAVASSASQREERLACQASLDTMIDERRLERERERAAVAAREREVEGLQRELARLSRERRATHESDPECLAWATAPVCPAVDRRLWPRTEETSPDGM